MGWRLGKINGMSSQSHLPHCRCCHLANPMSWFQNYVSHCRVLPLDEFTVTIPATCHIAGCSYLAKSMSRLCHIAGCKNSIRHIENCFRHLLFFFVFNAVWALTSGGFRIVSDTLVLFSWPNNATYSPATNTVTWFIGLGQVSFA